MTTRVQARAVFLGAPGAGKGTQAKRVAAAGTLAHISTGDMLRQEVASGSKLGLQAKSFMDGGKLVPDQLIIDMVRASIAQPDAKQQQSTQQQSTQQQSTQQRGKSAWILDGFPRTLPQAVALDNALPSESAVTHVIYFAVPEEILFGRLTGRRTCSKCGAIWHVETKPTKVADVCDICGGRTTQRSDDHPEKISVRLQEYKKLTTPLLDYYRSRRVLREIDANRSPDVVYQELLKLMQ